MGGDTVTSGLTRGNLLGKYLRGETGRGERRKESKINLHPFSYGCEQAHKTELKLSTTSYCRHWHLVKSKTVKLNHKKQWFCAI